MAEAHKRTRFRFAVLLTDDQRHRYLRGSAVPLRSLNRGRRSMAAIGMVTDQGSAGSTGSASDQGTFFAVSCTANGRSAETTD